MPLRSHPEAQTSAVIERRFGRELNPVAALGRSVVCGVLLCAALVPISLYPAAFGQAPEKDAVAEVTIQGTVKDPAGNLAGEATVHLTRKDGSELSSTRTTAAGIFTLHAPATGTYTVIAELSGLRSRPSVVSTSSPGVQPPISLILQASAQANAASSAAPAGQAMEFADQPNFTVAGVTDFTAVGGHGSDSILRTTESLTRETLTLKSDEGAPPGAAASRAGTGSGDSHRLAAERLEKAGDSLAAVREFELAVRLDPSEQNYFSWGSELLLHRAVWQAQAVFKQAAAAFPTSPRLLTALGTALFAGALYDDAALKLCDASDLNPSDVEPYLFMGNIEVVAPNPLACVEQKLARFAARHPENSLANYFYAMALLKSRAQPADSETEQKVELLLTKAVTLDPHCADAYLQLGVLAFDRRDFPKAIRDYTDALAADPQLADAHYRLAVAYDRTGDHARARREFDLHDEIKKQQADEIERQRREVKQFRVVLPDQPSSHPAP